MSLTPSQTPLTMSAREDKLDQMAQIAAGVALGIVVASVIDAFIVTILAKRFWRWWNG